MLFVLVFKWNKLKEFNELFSLVHTTENNHAVALIAMNEIIADWLKWPRWEKVNESVHLPYRALVNGIIYFSLMNGFGFRFEDDIRHIDVLYQLHLHTCHSCHWSQWNECNTLRTRSSSIFFCDSNRERTYWYDLNDNVPLISSAEQCSISCYSKSP